MGIDGKAVARNWLFVEEERINGLIRLSDRSDGLLPSAAVPKR